MKVRRSLTLLVAVLAMVVAGLGLLDCAHRLAQHLL